MWPQLMAALILACRYYTWAWATNFTDLPPYIMLSLQRSYDYISTDRSAYPKGVIMMAEM
jgi:hypothetical protein